ncbi:MAG: hypothetical protein H6662_16065 [Ardenticatenaceae bacterium]|nr:hypothetical protein [Anaerolineales bacterium]MCB8923103.1 hypothetical protein [Ardenticatenaceae bacterium]MCB8990030.1 hypothetical protein [Ardenticatenaceae bacterium]
MKLKVLLRVIGVVQLVLGLLYLFIPMQFLAMMGQSVPQPDIAYPLGMLAARFLAYGVGMFVIANAPEKNRFWINNMILIQVVDLAVGVFYTATGVVTLAHSGFPMFNATLFIILLTLWRPKADTAVLQPGPASIGN